MVRRHAIYNERTADPGKLQQGTGCTRVVVPAARSAALTCDVPARWPLVGERSGRDRAGSLAGSGAVAPDIRQIMPVAGSFIGATDAFHGLSADLSVTPAR
jgi:hypothetical protein